MQIVSIVFLFVLSFQVMPVAVGMDVKKTPVLQMISGVVLLVLGQLLLFLLGIWLGNRFMHLLTGIQTYVLFVGVFLIAVRFNMEAFKVRKGERTYVVDKSTIYIIPAISQAVNTFLAGILFYFMPGNLSAHLIYLAVFSFAFAILFVLIKYKKLALTAIAFLYMVAGGTLMAISFYFLFV
jgi:putative Mn2+ efflux pump MntP